LSAAFIKQAYASHQASMKKAPTAPARKYLVVNPTPWLNEAFYKRFFGLEDPALGIGLPQDDDTSGIWLVTRLDFDGIPKEVLR
jgi:hypothetical protein